MSALAGPLLVACLLLVGAGAAKLWQPRPATDAMAAVGVPTTELLVRVLGACEVALAVITVAYGGPWPLLVALTYAGFAIFVLAAVHKNEATSCGCFGARSAPPRTSHALMNGLLALCALGATGIDPLVDILLDSAWELVPLVAGVGLATYAGFRLLAAKPATSDDTVVFDLSDGGRQVTGLTPDGRTDLVRLEESAHPILLAFLSTRCVTCQHFWETFAAPLTIPRAATELVIVTESPDVEDRADVGRVAPAGVRVLMSSQAWDDFAVSVSPAFILVEPRTAEVSMHVAAATWEAVQTSVRLTVDRGH